MFLWLFGKFVDVIIVLMIFVDMSFIDVEVWVELVDLYLL